MTEWQGESSVWSAEAPVAPSVIGADPEPALATVKVRLEGPNGSAELAQACEAVSVLWDGQATVRQRTRENDQQ